MAEGRLSARLALVDGATRLVESSQCAPLKIARALPGEGLCEICVMDASPGLLAGDNYQLSWRLEDGARARVTTQGFTRVHPCGGNTARLRTTIDVAQGAALFYLPEPALLFRDASFQSGIEAQVAPGGALILLDILAAGRVARGEVFQFRDYSSRIHVKEGQKWLFAGQSRLCPGERDPRRPGAWGEATHGGQLLAFFAGADEAWLAAARQCLSDESITGDASRLDGGIAVSLLGKRACDLMRVALDIAAKWERLLIT